MATTTTTHDTHVNEMLAYLDQHCAGVDSHAFWTPEGIPDTHAARAFAERVRGQLGEHLDVYISVEQEWNRVKVIQLAVPVAVAS